MVKYYGLREGVNGKITTDPNIFPIQKSVWITRDNHNYNRIARIIRSLIQLGQKDRSAQFFFCMEEIYRNNSREMGDSLRHWQNAHKGKPSLKR